MDKVHVNNSSEHKITDVPQVGQYFLSALLENQWMLPAQYEC